MPVGPAADMVTLSNPRESAAAIVPSPRSATGSLVIWRSGRSSSKPLATASVTCAAVRQPLNLSGETTTRMTSVKQHDGDAGDGADEGLGGAFQLIGLGPSPPSRDGKRR